MRPIKIPTIIAFLFIALIIGGVSIAIEKALRIPSQASASKVPQNALVTNITESSATIVWETDELTSGSITATTPSGTKITAFDERDAIGKLGKYTSHSVPLKNLPAKTLITYKILVDGKELTSGKNTETFTTAPAISVSDSTLFDPAYGSIKTREGTPAEGALVILTIEEGQTLSTIVKPSGSWIIPLSTVRSKDLSMILTNQERLTEKLTVTLGNERSDITADTLNDSPLPDVLLGNTYDFRNYQALQKEKASKTLGENPMQSNNNVLGVQSTQRVGLTNPKQGASIVSTKPLIQGTGIPGKQISVTIGITAIQSGKTTVGGTGIWQFTPNKPLAPGKQSVTITTIDEKDKPVAITHEFTILKNGSQVLGDATPSATIEPTETPIATESSELIAEPMPNSGSPLPLIALSLAGIVLLGSGAILFFQK